jgi:circadian clock protein KaiC
MTPRAESAESGVAGLDDILGGGFPRDRVLLVEGDPGAGKTTLALQFLFEGRDRGEPCLHVSLGESRDELEEVAKSHGWSLNGINVLEVVPSESDLRPESSYTVFESAQVELEDTISKVLNEVERFKPRRVVIDSLSEFRLLAQSPLRYRHQTLALKQFFGGRDCTVLLLDDRTSGHGDLDLHSITHGVVTLEQLAPEFGGARRRLRVVKLRGRKYKGGWHDLAIERGGMRVFPRLVAHEQASKPGGEPLLSGVEGLDKIVGGGIDRGTGTMLIGPSGTGKSTLAAQYAAVAASQGERVAMFLFDERPATLLTRLDGLAIPLRAYVESGLVTIQQVDPGELSPNEFAWAIQSAVEPAEGIPASVVVVDSLNGYLLAMPEERFLNIQLHELLTYLGQLGVATFLTVVERGLIGTNTGSALEASYLADTVIALRYFESAGRVRQAIAVVKRRTGGHERTLREMTLGRHGITIGEPLSELQGLLSGVPVNAPNGLSAAQGQP